MALRHDQCCIPCADCFQGCDAQAHLCACQDLGFIYYSFSALPYKSAECHNLHNNGAWRSTPVGLGNTATDQKNVTEVGSFDSVGKSSSPPKNWARRKS